MVKRSLLDHASLLTIAEKLPAMLAYWGADKRCRFANRAYETWFGVAPEALVGRSMEDLLGPLYALNLPFIEAALRGEPQEFEREIPDPAGGPPRHSQAHYIPDVEDGVVRGFCVLVVDVSRRKAAENALLVLERQVAASTRLAAMSTLAAGIAHEINNPLAVTLGNIDLALRQLDHREIDVASIRSNLLDAREGALRTAKIVQSMKLLARGDVNARERVNVDDVVADSIRVADNVIRYRARVKHSRCARAFTDANATLLVQLFVNLLVNAAQSFGDAASSNEIDVTTRCEGLEVVVAITDAGVGISDALQARIFEPFFTTRDVGDGVGLGLPVALGIAESFGGRITVKSQLGRGSTFEVWLPAVESDARPLVPSAPPAAISVSHETRATLLLVDDEAALARVVARMIEDRFDVTVCTSGREAIALLLDPKRSFDVVLCDLMMPQLGGPDVYDRVVAARPDLAPRFVFMTGGAFTERGRAFLEEREPPLLEKPFTRDRAREALDEQLARTRR